MANNPVLPFQLAVPARDLARLRARIADTRWPDPEKVQDSSQGTPILKLRALCEYWQKHYDWRRCESALNAFGLYRTQIDGVDICFIHVRSGEPNAIPILLTHGWPGSVLEFSKVIRPLVDPVSHGADAADAFHVIAPSLPGFGFSGKPQTTGWGFARIADAWITLMDRLGYDRWVAQGGDLGSGVTEAIGRKRPRGCLGLHLNMSYFQPTLLEIEQATPEEQRFIARSKHYFDEMAGYAIEQGTRPQTIGYLLADSPVGQAAWIYEKFLESMGNRTNHGDALTHDEILDNIMMYWLPNSGASAARLYWELRHELQPGDDKPIDIPTGYSGFPNEVIRSSKRWLESRFSNLIHFNQLDRGGHFAALEQPQLFVDEVRATFRSLRQSHD